MKPHAVDPGATSRAEAYALWMDAPNPMVTFFKTLDVTPLVRLSRRKGLKFNMLLCWCIGSAASRVKEFYLLPVGKELLRYDTLAVNTIVKNRLGEGSSCDSAIIDTELDGAVGMNSGIFNNPFIIWGRYHRGLLKTTLTISFQFHHTQTSCAHAGSFLALVQENIRALRI